MDWWGACSWLCCVYYHLQPRRMRKDTMLERAMDGASLRIKPSIPIGLLPRNSLLETSSVHIYMLDLYNYFHLDSLWHSPFISILFIVKHACSYLHNLSSEKKHVTPPYNNQVENRDGLSNKFKRIWHIFTNLSNIFNNNVIKLSI